jgi:hypothetical protein
MMKSSLRSDEIASAVGGFNFIQTAVWISSAQADFILARAWISLKDTQPGAISRLGILRFYGDSPLQIVGLMGISLDLWGNRWIYEK